MNNIRINIAISGLGSSSADQLKICLRKMLPSYVGINWSNIADRDIDCLFVHEHFFDADHIQRVVLNHNVPYLKISRNEPAQLPEDRDTLYLPIQEDPFFQNWTNTHLLSKTNSSPTAKTAHVSEPQAAEKSIEIEETKLNMVQELYRHENRKFHLVDRKGTLAITDRRNHQVWLDPSRSEIKTDGQASCTDAVLADFVKVSRKNAYNLENWLFTLIWNSEITSEMPNENNHYKLQFWPQLLDEQPHNIVVKLSASFILGAQISEVATHFDIPLVTVQKFIAANTVYENAVIVQAQECLFKKQMIDDVPQQEQSAIKSFFGKLKRRFGF